MPNRMIFASSVVVICALLAVAIYLLTPKKKKDPYVCSLAGLKWTKEEFCQNFLVTGAIGSGKSTCVCSILDQLFCNSPRWGGLWLDCQGHSHEDLLRIAAKHGRRDDVVILECSDNPVYPVNRLNLLRNPDAGAQVTASIIAELSLQGKVRSKESNFFFQQSVIHVAKAIEFFRYAKIPFDLETFSSFLTSPYFMGKVLQSFGETKDKQLIRYFNHWDDSFMQQPPEQRGGVSTSIANALMPFSALVISDILASNHPDTVKFSDIDHGKILCVLIPSTYPKSKIAVNIFFKTLFYQHGAERYDQRNRNRDENLLVMFMDEAQEASSETDKHFLPRLRAAKCAFIAASQDESSFIPVLGHDLANTVIGQFRNRVIFCAMSPASAERSSELFGKREVKIASYSYGRNGTTRNVAPQDKPVLSRNHFLKLKNHYCSILHVNKKFRRKVKLPIT